MPQSIKKLAQVLVIALMPVLFIMGYFSFDGESSNSCDSQVAKAPKANVAAFVAHIDDQMVMVDSGKFNMGSNELTDRENPVHEVEVASFKISKAMVTVEQFGFFIQV